MQNQLSLFRQDPKLRILFPLSFFTNMGIGMLNFSLVYYMWDKFGSSPVLIGWLSAFWAAAYLAGCLCLGKVNAMLPPRLAMGLATLVMSGSVTGILLGTTAMVVFLCYMLFGFFTALFWPPLMGWLSEGKEGYYLSRAIAGFNLCWSSGVAVSPYLAGLLLQSNLNLPLVAVCALYALLTLVITLAGLLSATFRQQTTTVFPAPGVTATDEPTGLIPASAPAVAIPPVVASAPAVAIPPVAASALAVGTIAPPPLTSTPLRFPAWGGIFSSYLLHGAIIFIFPLYARDRLGYSEAGVGLLLLLRALMSVLGFQLASRYVWWHHNRTQILASQGLLLVVAVLLSFLHSLFFLTSLFILFGLIFALQYSSSIFHGVSGSRQRERRMAVHEIMLSAGLIAGAAGGGICYELQGIESVFLFCAGLLVLILIFQLMFIRKTTAGKLAVKTNGNSLR